MLRVIPILFVSFVLWLPIASADEFTSSDFKILEPVISPAGYSTSSSYILVSTVSQIAIGTSTSASFEARSGFLYFPAPSSASTPTPTPTPAPAPVGGGGILGMVGLLFGLPTTVPLPHLPIQISRCGISDFNCDEATDLADISSFLFLISYAPEGNPADVNSDGVINLADASIVFSGWTGIAYQPPPAFFEREIIRRGAASVVSPFSPQGQIVRRPAGLQKETAHIGKTEVAGSANILMEAISFVAGGVLRIWHYFSDIVK